MHEFVQNSVFRRRSARTVIFALGAPLFNSFQQSARVCTKQHFQPKMSTLLSFSHWAHHLLALFSKVHEFAQNSVFSPRSAGTVIFALGAPLFSVFSKVHEFVQDSVFSRRSARFNIFELGAPLFSDFQQRASVCPKERLQPEISTFPHFRTGYTTFKRVHEFLQNSVFSPRSARFVIFVFSTRFSFFQQSARVCTKQRFQPEISRYWVGAPLSNSFQQTARVCPKSKTALLARDQHVLSISHCAHHLLAIFSKVHEFFKNSVFSPRSACSVIFTLGTPLLSVFSKVHEFVQDSVFSWRSARFNTFELGAPLFSDFQQRASVCP